MPRTPKSPKPSKRASAQKAKKPRAAESPPTNAETDEDESGEESQAEAGSDEGDAAPESDSALAAEPEADVIEEVEPSEDVPVVSEPPGSITRFDPMQAYLREVQRHPLLTPEQTHEIAVRFGKTQDPADAALLVTSNLRLGVKIAYEYRRAYKNIMDLVQEGNIGLMQAVKRYDPYRGVKLSSYAAWWIRAYILRFILNNWRLVKLGTTQAQRSCSSTCGRSAPSWWRWGSIPPTPKSPSS